MSTQRTPQPIALTIGQLGQGGSERQLYYFLSHCDRTRWRPFVFVSGALGFWEAPIRALDIPVMLLEGGQLAKLRQFRAACVAAGVRRFFSWSSYTNGYALALGGLGIKRLGSFRNYLFNDLPEERRTLWVWLSLAGISTAICNSRATYEALGGRLKGRKKLVFVPNSVESPQDPACSRAQWRTALGIGADETLVVGVGRLTPQKNFARFVDTIALVGQCGPVRAVVAGEDLGSRAELEARCKAVGLAPDTLRFIGAVPDGRELICAADIFLLTSDYEGTPNVVLEAMAAGVPVVCTATSNVDDLMADGCEGFVVAPQATALAEKVCLLAHDRALRTRVGAAAAARIKRQFEPRPIAEQLWALCD